MVSGHPKFTRIPRVDGLSTGPLGFGASLAALLLFSFLVVYFPKARRGDFIFHSWPEITPLNLFRSFSFLIKWFFHEDLCFISFFILSFYRCFVCHRFISVWFVIVLLV